MVEISFREYSEQADLAGKSVAQARELYQSVFDIPDKARAKLNDKEIKPKLEPETILKEDDELIFAEKSKKKLYLVTAMLAALAITGGIFAYAVTTTTTTLGLVAVSDFASVSENYSDNLTGSGWTAQKKIFGAYKGTLPRGNMFSINPAEGYPGDLVAVLSIGNGDELVKVYRVLCLKIFITEADMSANITSPGILTLSKGELELPIDVHTYTSSPYQVYLDGGFYVSHRWAGFPPFTSGFEAPLIYIDVVQR